MKKRNIIFTTILLVLGCFAFSPSAKAVVPPPDGGYRNHNTAEGDHALLSLTTGFGDTAHGFEALLSNTTGSYDVATGHHALVSNTTGQQNTATGTGALFDNTTGSFNTAVGEGSLNSNTSGNLNTATGVLALLLNTTGDDNTATGVQALRANTTGYQNTASGVAALNRNTTGIINTATGVEALFSNTTGIGNTADGVNALAFNTTGQSNTAQGVEALLFNTVGDENTASGVDALAFNSTGVGNTADGFQALLNNTTGASNIALGYNAGSNLTTGDNNIDIGNTGVAAEANTIRIGATDTQTTAFIAGISGTAISGAAVVVNASGQVGVAASSARFKDEIKPMDKGSEAILALKPVTFRYKKAIDPKRIPQFGLVAEQVAKVSPDLVVRDEQGKVYTVRYDAVNAMLLNEFLKEHRRVKEQQASIIRLGPTVARQEEIITEQQRNFGSKLAKQERKIEALASGLQAVNARMQLTKSAPQLVRNDH